MARASSVDGALFPFPYRTERLENGLTVILVPMAGTVLAAYYSIVRTGSRDEVEPGRTGFAHFFEHMMFRGTPRHPGPEYDATVSSLGADSNAYTSEDCTVYHLDVAAADLPRVVELEADRFQNLAYGQAEFQTEAEAVYAELRAGHCDPWRVLDEALRGTAFGCHPYGHTVMGCEADIAAMPAMYGYSREFFRRFYRPENVVILVVGGFEPEVVLSAVRRHYGEWEPGLAAAAVPVEPPQTGPRDATVVYRGRTLPLVTVAWKSPAFDPGDPVMVAGSLLGELVFGEASAVYRELVLEHTVAEHLEPDFSLTRDPGLWRVTAAVSEARATTTVRAALERAVVPFARELIARGMLERLCRRVRYGFLMALDTPDHVADEVTRPVALSGGMESVDRLLATVAALTPEDVRAAARRYLDQERRTVVLLTGEEE